MPTALPDQAVAPVIEAVLRRERLIIGVALMLICTLSWAWVLVGAGTGMKADAMSTWQFPPPALRVGSTAAWSVSYWLIMVSMWWVMMVAMMLPSAAPMILLYARVCRRSQERGGGETYVLVPTARFLGGYLLVWLAFSLGITALHRLLESAGLVHAMMMWSTESRLTAGFLLIAGIYQLSPLKRVCLGHCRHVVNYLSTHWRSGSWGALRMGMGHGRYCVGCCWSLMLLLFVGGVMNLVWIAGLAILVLLEKLAPRGDWLAAGSGLILIVLAGVVWWSG